MSRRANFVPLSQFEESCWDVKLPEYVDPDRIGIHTSRLGVLANLAGYKDHVHVISADGDTTQHNPMIVGNDSQGNAFGAMGGVKPARLSNVEGLDYDRRGTIHTSPFLQITVNTKEMTQRLQHKKANVRTPEPWAAQLNDAIGNGLRDAAWEHMIGHPKYPEIINAVWAGMIAGVTAPEASGPLALSSVAMGICMMNSLKGVSSIFANAPAREVCWSVLPIIHPDRALAVTGLTHMCKIVKALP